MYIESPRNPRVRVWSQLKEKKGRTEQRRFLVEGIRLVEEVLRSSLEVEALLWDVSTDDPPQALQDAAMERGVPMFELAPKAFAAVADTVTPQGLIAVAHIPVEPPAYRRSRYALLLDDVHDPGNAGTLLRTADAFGIGEVYFGTGTVDPYAPKVVRASMGGLFRVPVRVSSTADCIDGWRAAWPDGQVVLADADAELSCTEVDFGRPTLIIIGGEARGASQAALDRATVHVRIPMEETVESLNAAVAGAILLYEAYRQRRFRTPSAID